MSIEVFPAPSTAAGPDGQVFSITEAYKTYKITDTFLAGGYTITTSPTTAQVGIVFMNASTSLASGDTVSGTGSYNIASDATNLYIEELGGSTNTVVTITYVAESVSSSTVSGTLDTITTTSTYNTTGLLYAVVVGGGGSGGNCGAAASTAGAGGGSGGITGAITYANTSTSITIGTGGVANANRNNGVAGGSTTFGSILTGGGGGGGNENGTRGNGGTNTGGLGTTGGFGGTGVGGSAPDDATAVSAKHLSVVNGTTGGGGGGGGNGPGGPGKGSGIGTGGTGGRNGTAPTNANGYGAGGGGGASNTNTANEYKGGSGSAGVVYVLRGF